MVALYVTSSEKGTGKTAVSAALGKRLVGEGKKVGYFKPIISGGQPVAGNDSDAAFMKRVLALDEPVEAICPSFIMDNTLGGKVKEAYSKIAAGKDVVIIEASAQSAGIAEALDARVIAVETGDLPKATASLKIFGKRLLGVVVNKVTASRVDAAKTMVAAQLKQAGTVSLGVLPESRALVALTVGELAEQIQGQFLSGADKSSDLIENIMLGALCVDPGPTYFGRKLNKAVILKSDRPDMQLAALETPTRCLVLAGSTAPQAVIINRAAEKKVPIITVKNDVTTVESTVEGILGKTRFNQEAKMSRFNEIMDKGFDYKTVYAGLGIR